MKDRGRLRITEGESRDEFITLLGVGNSVEAKTYEKLTIYWNRNGQRQ